MPQFASGDNVVHVLIWNVLGGQKKKNTEFIFWWVTYYSVYKGYK